MKRILLGALVVAAVSAAGAAAVQAQGAQLGLGGGVINPTGDYATADKAGWHGLGTLEFSIPAAPTSIRIDAMYGQTSHKGTFGGNTKLFGSTADLVWHAGLPKAPARFYLLGGLGFYNVKVDVTGFPSTSESKFAFDLGAGVSAGMGSAKFFGEARFISVRTSGGATNFIPISVGVLFGL
jgi:opacity protein-like surface antigen